MVRFQVAGIRLKVFGVLVVLISSANAEADNSLEVGQVVRASLPGTAPIVGEILERDTSTLKLLDLKTLRPTAVRPDDLAKLPQVLVGPEIANAIGLPSYFAWQIQRFAMPPLAGKIAEMTPSAVYVTLSRKTGAEVGQQLRVSRNQGVVADPETGEVLAQKRTFIGMLRITSVEERVCKARRSDNLETEIAIGDIVEVDTPARKIAVFPLSAMDGDAALNAEGQWFAEQITTRLVEKQVPVVERSQLLKVLAELTIEQSRLFDTTNSMKVGKQLGAYALLTGSLVRRGKLLEANVRLIRVETGEILAAASGAVQSSAQAAAKPAPTPNGNPSTAKWKNETYGNTLTHLKGKEWAEFDNKTGKRGLEYTEIVHTADSLELFCAERNWHVRFLSKKMELKKNGKWEWISNGHWESK